MVGTTDQGNWKTIRFVKFLWGYCSDCHPPLPSWRASCRWVRTADQSQSRCWELLRTGLRAANSVSEVGPGGECGAGGDWRPGRDTRLALNLSVAARTRAHNTRGDFSTGQHTGQRNTSTVRMGTCVTRSSPPARGTSSQWYHLSPPGNIWW